MGTERTFTLPHTLTVEDTFLTDPNNKYGDPVAVVIVVKFGDHEVARYELKADHWSGEFYYNSNSDPNHKIRYDEPEEFVANKLRKLFQLIED